MIKREKLQYARIDQFMKKKVTTEKERKEADLKKTAKTMSEGGGNNRQRREERKRRRRRRRGWRGVELQRDRLPECFTEGDGASNFNNWI